MKDLYKQKRQSGFTIIEVLIVLAIAALILLIVFLAVPALQRNSRNNGIRNDSAVVLAAVNDYASNNQGSLPAAQALQTGPIICIGGAAATPCPASTSEAKVRGGTTITVFTGGCTTAPATLGQIDVRTGCKCSATTIGTSIASARAISAQFSVEATSGANSPQCIES
ncbi:prepilin-type N-terminal cleavage/methylation domain-containing protein [Candidatus Saccharibacteria bacterium]|nr:prepilin-type N-terminal cleavage/methylation domain-containing protein [Candidatus Saccharibacteria bacterium]